MDNREHLLRELGFPGEDSLDPEIVLQYWNSYEPKQVKASLSASDGSYNTLEYVDKKLVFLSSAGVHYDRSWNVSRKHNLEHLVERNRIKPNYLNDFLSMRMSTLELRTALDMLEKLRDTDILLLDGSLGNLMKRFKPNEDWLNDEYDEEGLHLLEETYGKFRQTLSELILRRNDLLIVGVSKTMLSEKIKIVKDIPIHDAFLFSFFTEDVGYSQPKELEEEGIALTYFYVRFSKERRIYRLEVLRSIAQIDMEFVMDALCTASVRGYPFPLRRAHDECTITKNDMKHVQSMLKPYLDLKEIREAF